MNYTIAKVDNTWQVFNKHGDPMRRRDHTLFKFRFSWGAVAFCEYFELAPFKVVDRPYMDIPIAEDFTC
jgi:hypothetical protein